MKPSQSDLLHALNDLVDKWISNGHAHRGKIGREPKSELLDSNHLIASAYLLECAESLLAIINPRHENENFERLYPSS